MKLSLKRRCSTRRFWPRMWRSLHVDLRGLREARELLVGRLGGDDAGRLRAEVRQPHGEAAGIERMELHEAGPGLVEQDVVAEMADALRRSSRRCRSCRHRCIARSRRRGTAARLRQASGSFDQRMVADALAQCRLVERVPAHRADQAPGVAVGRHDRPGCRRRSSARRDGRPCGCCGRTARGRRRRRGRRARPCWRSRCR